jgi:cob(I)alamin adenosyltransferase
MVKLNKIYTRTGDDGTTGLVDGSRIGKDDPRMAAIGEVDELNSMIGFAVSQIGDAVVVAGLQRIQNDLFDLGADLATPGDDFAPSEMVLRIIPSQAVWIETQIDALNDQLSPLTSFILPGGSAGAGAVHLARAIARRTERAMVAAQREMPINPAGLAYINRLSDYLFVLARHLNGNGADDILWKPGASR